MKKTRRAQTKLRTRKSSLEQQLIDTQRQLLEAQQKIIELQQQVIAMTPANAPDDEIFWHIHSKGKSSVEAANSDNLDDVKQFRDWNVKFAKTFIKPYVNPSVYGECLNQMTRGLGDRIASLETQKEIKAIAKETNQKIPSSKPIVQLKLLDA